jgi:predicted small secreted protein
MSTTITTQMVVAWDTALRLEAQQKESRLMKTVVDKGTIEGASFTINNLGTIGEFDENVVRHGDTIWSEIDHSARNTVMRDFYKALPVDRNDVPKLKANPLSGGYMDALMAMRNRKIDSIIYQAGIGTIPSQDGLVSYVLPAGQKIVNGGTGMTKAKIIQAKSIFRANEADENTGEELFFIYNDVMLQQILADTTLTSADHTTVQMLQNGTLNGSWMGFKWIPYQGINRVSTVYQTMAYTKTAIHFGRGYEEGKVSPRPDKKDATQTSMAACYGAGRQDDKKVVQIDFV